jgi:hypothetical protein
MQMFSTTHWLPRFDQLGAILSFGCAIHCIGAPVFLTMLPMGLHGLFTEEFESLFLICTLSLALLTHAIGFCRHQSGFSLGVFSIALVILATSRLVPEESGRGLVTLLGGLILATSHLINHRHCKIHKNTCTKSSSMPFSRNQHINFIMKFKSIHSFKVILTLLTISLSLTYSSLGDEALTESEVQQLKKAVRDLQKQVEKQNEILKDHGITHRRNEKVQSDEQIAISQDPLSMSTQGSRPAGNMFNPSISAAIDTVSTFSRNDGVDFAVRAAEIMIDSNIDQYAYAYAILNAATELDLEERTGSFRRNAEGTRVNLEEAAIQTTSLPHGLALKGGRYFADFTQIGKVHPHHRPFVDGPRSVDSIIGGETMAQGFELTWLTPIEQYTRLTFGMADGIGSEPPHTAALTLPDGSERSAFVTTGHRSFDDLTWYTRGATIFELASGVNLHFGANYATSFHDAKRQIASADLKLDYKPHANRSDRFVWGTEALWSRQRGNLPLDSFLAGGVPFTSTASAEAVGAYTYIQHRFGKYWEPGFRFDVTVPESFEMRDVDGDGNANDLATLRDRFYTYSAYLSAYPTEYQRLRLQLSLVDIDSDALRGSGSTAGRNDLQVWLQWTVFLGAHKHPFTP